MPSRLFPIHKCLNKDHFIKAIQAKPHSTRRLDRTQPHMTRNITAVTWRRAIELRAGWKVSVKPNVRGSTVAIVQEAAILEWEVSTTTEPPLPRYLRLMRNVSNWHFLCDLLFPATLHCTTDGNIILAVARESTVPSIDLTTVALLGNDGPQCRPIVAPAFIIYQFNPNQCGTELNVRIATSV